MTGKILITGAEGQLGAELCRQLGEKAIGLRRAQLDVLDDALVRTTIKCLRPIAVINTAAFTAVDRAESETADCDFINYGTVVTLADVCRDVDCALVQISTDYVFGGERTRRTPYRETDCPQPINTYGWTKSEGENAAAKWRKHFIVRTCGLYGRRNKPTQSNFVDTMLRLGRERDRLRVVDDQTCSPTYTVDLVRAVVFLLSTDAYGTYHVVNSGETTWYDFACEIFRIAGISTPIDRITTAEYNAPAARPSYSVLDTTKYHALGGPVMRSWQNAVNDYLRAAVSPLA